MKKRKKSGKRVLTMARVKRIGGAAKAVSKVHAFFKKYILPIVLISFAVIAYAVFDVPIPEKARPRKRKKS